MAGKRRNIYCPDEYSEDKAWDELIDEVAAKLQHLKIELKPYRRRMEYTASDVIIKALEYLADHDTEEDVKNL